MTSRFILAAAAALTLAACAPMPQNPTLQGPVAHAALSSASGSNASGQAHFTQRGSTVLVSGEIRGLKPNAVHGFHVHEKGDCSSGDGMSTGGHFNPTGKPHGKHADTTHHAGDLQSLTADAFGVAKFRFEAPGLTVGSAATDVVGRGLIVHRDPDDYKTQPTGNAGPRIACAVITKG